MSNESQPADQPQTVSAAAASAGNYQENRTPEQLIADQQAAEQQISGLSAASSYQRARQLVEDIRARQGAAPTKFACPFDVHQLPGPDVAPPYVLAAHGQLVVRIDPPHPDAHTLPSPAAVITGLGYTAATGTQLAGFALSATAQIRVFHSDKNAAEVLADVESLARDYQITATPNLILPLGYLVKGDNFPFRSAGLNPRSATSGTPTVRVAMIDTGIGPVRTDGWLTTVTATAQNRDLLDVVPELGRLDWGSGHGTFSAGIVQQIAPKAEIVMYRCTQADGLATEVDVANALLKAATDGSQRGIRTIINASLGSPAVPGTPLVALQAAIDQIAASYPDVLIVASAGNLGTNAPVYPAAYPSVVAVGAVEEFGSASNPQLRPASFSSFGSWVDCSSVGVGVVSTFVAGLEPPQVMSSYPDLLFGANAVATWSGTSFSAPQISAEIARRCSLDPNLTPKQALNNLLATPVKIDGYGKIVKLLPGTLMP